MRKVKSIAKTPFPAPDVVTKVVRAPTDGWDAISPLAIMDPKRAPILDNWVPRPGYVELRAGYSPYVVKLTASPVESLMVLRAPTGQQMFAASGDGIYDVSVAGGTSKVVSGLSSARFQYVNFRPLGSTVTYIQCCNGLDALRQYDGSAWTSPVITGLPAGFTTSDIINIYAQKRRLWYTLKNSSIAAFMPTDAITGAIAGTLDLGALWTKGGFLVAVCDWTLDGGFGPNDYAVFMSSQGQVTVYSGVDPTNATDWQLVGVFDLPLPLGRRSMQKVGSDVAIITLQGVLPISQALPFDPSADRSVSLTSRIQNAMAQAAMQGQNLFGWQFISYPAQQLAILNVPLTENSQQVQFVMNALTGAWCRFTGWNANCFEIYNNLLYWGGNVGDVNLGYSSGSDGQVSIPADMQCAFNYFDDPGRTKHMTMVQPLLVAGGVVNPTLQVDADFATSTSVAPISIIQGGALWDQAIWDQAVWPLATITVTDWHSVDALGHALAVRMKVNIAASSVAANEGLFDISLFDSAQFDGAEHAGNQAILQVNAFNTIMEMGGFI